MIPADFEFPSLARRDAYPLTQGNNHVRSCSLTSNLNQLPRHPALLSAIRELPNRPPNSSLSTSTPRFDWPYSLCARFPAFPIPLRR